MDTRSIGTTGIEVSRVGLGCVTFGREIGEDESFRILDFALEHGINLFDTAEAYGGGQAREYRRKHLGIDDVREATGEMHSSEKILGRWLRARGCRDRIVLQTKVSTNFTPEHVAEAAAASLDRLQTDFIDLYLFHSPDPNTPIELALEGMTRLVRSGKVRAAGCSNFSPAQLREALSASRSHGLERLQMIQPDYSLVARDIETELLPLCRREEVAVISYSPLAAGFLAGKYTPDRQAIPKGTRFDVIEGHADVYFTEQNFRMVDHLRQHSAELGLPMVQVALEWVLGNPDITSVLVGARTIGHLENALRAEAGWRSRPSRDFVSRP